MPPLFSAVQALYGPSSAGRFQKPIASSSARDVRLESFRLDSWRRRIGSRCTANRSTSIPFPFIGARTRTRRAQSTRLVGLVDEMSASAARGAAAEPLDPAILAFDRRTGSSTADGSMQPCLKPPVDGTCAAGNSNERYPTPGTSLDPLWCLLEANTLPSDLRASPPSPSIVRSAANPRRGRRREAYAATAKPILAGAPAFYTEKTL